MDVDGNLTLDRTELKTGFQQMGLNLNTRELEEVFWEFDRDRSGAVSCESMILNALSGNFENAQIIGSLNHHSSLHSPQHSFVSPHEQTRSSWMAFAAP